MAKTFDDRADVFTISVGRRGFRLDRTLRRHPRSVLLGRALGHLEDKGFRIAQMGHVNAPTALGALGVVELALAALRLPHGRGWSDGGDRVSGAGRAGVNVSAFGMWCSPR